MKLRRFACRAMIAGAFALAPALVVSGTSTASTAPGHAATPRLAPSSAECKANQAAGVIQYASPFGYDASAGIIDVYAATKLGYFSALCLNVHFVVPSISESPYTLLSADKVQFSSEGSAADVLLGQSNGGQFVGIATYGDTSDYALLTRPGITKLTQLKGKLLAYHTVLPVVLTEMLVKAGVNPASVHTTNDETYNPILVSDGKYDALQAYQSNEPITLRALHDPFLMWTPAQFGVTGTFNVVVANRTFYDQHRAATADVLRAELHAFDYCSVHVATCVSFIQKAQGSTFNVAHATAEWKLESVLASGHTLAGRGVGIESTAEWTPEAKALVTYKLVKHAPNLAADEDTTLAASLYMGSTLVWP